MFFRQADLVFTSAGNCVTIPIDGGLPAKPIPRQGTIAFPRRILFAVLRVTTHTPPGDNHLLCKKFQSNSPGCSPIPVRGRKCRKRTPVRCAFFVCQIVSVGATLGRPWILLRKIHRRQAKTGFFSCGKSEKHRFSAGDHGSPLRYSQK